MDAPLPPILRQFGNFFGVSIVATVAHYGVLIGLVELAAIRPVPAALAGYLSGGLVSYLLNRWRTFATERRHFEAGWRFASVMTVGFGLTWLLMRLLVDRLGLPYLPAQVVTTGLVFLWNFAAHKFWTFGR